MSYSASVFVYGEPKGQPRPRAFSRGGKARVYDPGTAEGWKSAIAEGFRKWLPPSPLAGRVSVEIKAAFARPKGHWKKDGRTLAKGAPLDHVQKPDADNMAKAVLDALTTIGMWQDDAQVNPLIVSRSWAAAGEASVTLVRVSQPHAAPPQE